MSIQRTSVFLLRQLISFFQCLKQFFKIVKLYIDMCVHIDLLNMHVYANISLILINVNNVIAW